jgi:hypothetical protein
MRLSRAASTGWKGFSRYVSSMDWNSRHWGWALALELAPAALFNFAVAFAVATLVGGSAHAAFAAEAAVAAGLAAFLVAWAALRRCDSASYPTQRNSYLSRYLPISMSATCCRTLV